MDRELAKAGARMLARLEGRDEDAAAREASTDLHAEEQGAKALMAMAGRSR